jgi:glycosyltransferase involved in cell wall biosynthesis
MASERPAVVTSVGANADLVDDNQNGFLIEPRDFRSLAARILQLAADRDLRCAFGKHARRKVETEFSLPRMLENYARLYALRTAHQPVAGTAMGRA